MGAITTYSAEAACLLPDTDRQSVLAQMQGKMIGSQEPGRG